MENITPSRIYPTESTPINWPHFVKTVHTFQRFATVAARTVEQATTRRRHKEAVKHLVAANEAAVEITGDFLRLAFAEGLAGLPVTYSA